MRRAANRAADGSAFIFHLEEVGLSSSDPREAVQVYRWVDGDTLATRTGALAPHLVIDIGLKLTRALRLLHEQGILHRDIQPGNIVIDEGESAASDLRPVLIDFGFARVIGRDMRTRLAGEYAAPEVAADRPDWSRASDVYALCATLRSVLNKQAPGSQDVLAVLAAGLQDAPASRPTAEAFGQRLESLATQQLVQQQRDQAWEVLRARFRSGAHIPELSRTVNRHRTVLEMLDAGAYRNQEERHRVIADVVNQFVELKTRFGLNRVAADSRSQSVAVLYALRVLHAHPETILHRDHRAALDAYRSGTAERRSATVREALSVVSAQMSVPALATLLEVYA